MAGFFYHFHFYSINPSNPSLYKNSNILPAYNLMFTRLTCRYRLHFITFSLILLWLLNDQHELLTEKLRKKAKPFTGSFARPRSYFSAQLTYLNPSYLSHLRNQTVQISKTIFPFKEGLDPGWKLRNQNTLKRLLDCQSHLPDSNCQEKDNHIILLGTVHFSRVVEGVFNEKASFPSGEGICKGGSITLGSGSVEVPIFDN
ncbi:expressed protein [Phakopsora pachyrhizi]|uniref:Expressed protein n=1 Tax=Phakopsora pachyrhizi TaxID=170000 RepID=A0AAV0ARD4_PHAPC|nr:expressed protein [Phakopsora pachyrhizi]